MLSCRQCDVDHRNKDGLTALMRAAGSGHNACVELLLKFGASRDLVKAGKTALDMATQYRHYTCVELLQQGWGDPSPQEGGSGAGRHTGGSGGRGGLNGIGAGGERGRGAGNGDGKEWQRRFGFSCATGMATPLKPTTLMVRRLLALSSRHCMSAEIGNPAEIKECGDNEDSNDEDNIQCSTRSKSCNKPCKRKEEEDESNARQPAHLCGL